MYIVYHSDMSTGRTVTLAYELGSAGMVQEVVLYLRNKIAEAIERSPNLPWPPTDDFLRQSDVPPSQLKIFLNRL